VSDEQHDTPHTPAPSLWPIGFAIGVACILVGLVVSVPALIVGALIALVFGFLWIRDLFATRPVDSATAGAPTEDTAQFAAVTEADLGESVDRATFLSLATIGVGGLIGAAITVPVLGFAVLPSFTGEGVETYSVDLGPISNFPEGEYVIATFLESPEQGEVSRRTAFIRNNGRTDAGVPSFTALYSRCVHLGCPVQPNGPIDEEATQEVNGVELRPVLAASFGCPCHGGLYDSEGNRSAGPPVRSLDRFEFSIVDGNLVLGRVFSVGSVEGTGAKAQISKYYKAYPGVHVDGVERILYPFPTPGSTG
jgi:Rieske Fe-S protein